MNRINSITHLAALAIGIAALTAPGIANAQTFYNSLAAFNAAATTSTLYTFENIAPPGSLATNPPALVTPAPGRITFAVSGGGDTSVYVADSRFNNGNLVLSDGTDSVVAGLSNSASLATTRLNLDASYTAFAIEIGQRFNFTNVYTIGLYNNDTQVGNNFTSGFTNDIFFGATSDTAFNNIRVLTAQGDNGRSTVFDNARTGSAIAVVPEAGSLALILPALGVLGVAVRKRRVA